MGFQEQAHEPPVTMDSSSRKGCLPSLGIPALAPHLFGGGKAGCVQGGEVLMEKAFCNDDLPTEIK